MFRLLTADDEPDKLEALRIQCNWKNYQVEICGEAQNGFDAYEQILAKRPDICIMDIKMPLLSGLDVIQRAQKMGVHTKYIILSGYDEFDYAKEAICLSVVDYLLKPCRPEDIARSVEKCICLIENEKKQNKLQEDYRHLLEDNTENSREHLLNELILGTHVENLEARKRQCRLEFLGNSVAVCVFVGEGLPENREKMQECLTEMRIQAEATLACTWPAVVLNIRDQVVAVAGMDSIIKEFNGFSNLLKSTAESCRRKCGVKCSVGVSDCKSDLSLLSSAYQEAKQAAETARFLSERDILFFAELNEKSNPAFSENPELQFLRNLADPDKIEALATQFLESCNACSVDVQEKTKESVVELVCSLYKLCQEWGISFKELSVKKSTAVRQIMESGTINAIRKILTGFILTIGKNMSDSNSISALIRRTILYVQQNYASHITLDSAAQVIHVTPSYLSMLFKQQTGLSFIEYVNQYRVKQAEELLRAGNLKSYEIAFAVGFQDEKYFHNIFKRYTGMTTRQFRDRSCLGDENLDCVVLGPLEIRT